MLATCVLVTLGMHAIALCGAARMVGAKSVRPVGVGRAPPVRLAARAAERSGAEVPVATPPRQDRPAPTARPVAPALAARASGRPGASNEPPDADGGGPGYRFYGAREVDVTAEPVSEWNLDPSALDALATSRVVFTLFVGRDGSILHCSVDEPEHLSPGQRQALAARLAETEMRPARRAGVPVPSRRRVEIFTVGGV